MSSLKVARHVAASVLVFAWASYGCGKQHEQASHAPAAEEEDAAPVVEPTVPEVAPASDSELAETEPEPDPEPEPKPEPEPEPENAVEDDLERCGPAQEKLIEIGRLVDASIAAHMERKRKGWVAKCKCRVEDGDAEFIEDLRCVADSTDFDGLIRCDGWTDWPGM